MATSCSSTSTWPNEQQEEAHVPPAGDGINSVVLQMLPQFQRENPILWFSRAEAAMQVAGLTSDIDKYSYVVGMSLDMDTLTLLQDIVISPPATEKFRTIKERLLQLFGQDEETNARHLLRTCRMGDEKPSDFLQRLRSLAGNKVPDTILKSIFLEQVPGLMHDILIANEKPDLNKLAILADRVASLEQNHVAIPAQRNNMAAQEDYVTLLLTQKIAELARQLDKIKMENAQHGWRGRSTSRSGRSPARSRSSSAKRNSGVCYYHRRFGAWAYHCLLPCAWVTTTGNNTALVQAKH